MYSEFAGPPPAAEPRRALILKIEEKVAEVSGGPIHPDETALVGTWDGIWSHDVPRLVGELEGTPNCVSHGLQERTAEHACKKIYIYIV